VDVEKEKEKSQIGDKKPKAKNTREIANELMVSASTL
jgi:hypothetical protein